MGLPPFSYYSPRDLGEALNLVDRLGEEARVLAGGTELIPQMRSGKTSPVSLVDIGGLESLRTVELAAGQLYVGALATHSELASSPLVAQVAPVLSDACASVGSPPIRNVGTIGGNLVGASPAADAAPALLVLEATVHVRSIHSERQIAIADFFIEPGHTTLQPDELLVGISVPLSKARVGSAFLKFGKRKAQAVAVVSVAAYVSLVEGSDEISDVRIALGSVGPIPFRAREAERMLRGGVGELGRIEEAARCAADATRPISDVRASAEYRRLVTGVLVERAVCEVWSRARGGDR